MKFCPAGFACYNVEFWEFVNNLLQVMSITYFDNTRSILLLVYFCNSNKTKWRKHPVWERPVSYLIMPALSDPVSLAADVVCHHYHQTFSLSFVNRTFLLIKCAFMPRHCAQSCGARYLCSIYLRAAGSCHWWPVSGVKTVKSWGSSRHASSGHSPLTRSVFTSHQVRFSPLTRSVFASCLAGSHLSPDV